MKTRWILPLVLLMAVVQRPAHSKVVDCRDLVLRVRSSAKRFFTKPIGFSTLLETNRFLIGANRGDAGLIKTFLSDLKILDKNTLQPVGVTRLFSSDDVVDGQKLKTLRILPLTLGDMRHRGVSTEAKFALLKYGFEKLGADRSTAMIKPDNVASLELHKKLGFKPSNEPNIYVLSRADFAKLSDEIGPNGLEEFVTPAREREKPLIKIGREVPLWRTPTRESPIAETPHLMMSTYNKNVNFDKEEHMAIRITDRNTHDVVGIVQLGKVEFVLDGKIEWMLHVPPYLGKEFRGRGLGFEAKVGALTYGFQMLHLSKSIAWIEPTNVDSIEMHERLGYTKVSEGFLNHGAPIDFYVLTREKFESMQDEIRREITRTKDGE